MASQTLSASASNSATSQPSAAATNGASTGSVKAAAAQRAETAERRRRPVVAARAQSRPARSESRNMSKPKPKVRPVPARRRTPGKVEAVKERVGAVTDAVGGALASAGSTASGSVKQHPVPAALIGAGLAWLLLETRTARSAEAKLLRRAKRAVGTVGEALSPLGESAGESFGQARDTARDAMTGTADAVGRAVGTAAEAVAGGAVTLAEIAKSGVSTAGTALRDGAAAVGEAAKAGYGRSREAVADTWERHPLMVGASLLAAGLATGMLLPAVRPGGNAEGRKPASEEAERTSEALKTAGSELYEKGRAMSPASAKAASASRKGRTGGARSSAT